MPQHISRKELKTDQVQEALWHSSEAVLTHKKALISTAIVVAVIIGAIFGWRFYTQRQSLKASAEFGAAMQVFQAPVVTPGTPPPPNMLSYSNSSKKYQDALTKFEAVVKRYPRTHAGQLSRYYAGLCFEKLGKDTEAVHWLAELQNSANPDFAALARFELAQMYDREGKSSQAVLLYNELMANPSVLVPKPVVMLALAEHYGQSDPIQAAKLYNQIKTEYPDTGAADQAGQQLALLPSGKS